MTTHRQHFLVVTAFVLLSPIAAHAQTLTVAWDPNPSADQVTSYEVCIGTASLSCSFRRASVATSETSYEFTPNGGVLYYVAVRAISASGAGAYSQEVTVSTPSLNQPANQTSTVNQPISPLSLSASDPDGNTLRFSHTGLPFGLTLNTTTGVITGTPTNTGTFNVSVFVADSLVTTSRSFVWTVTSGSSSDTTQPSLAITSHTSGQTVTTSSITLTGTASDSGAGGSGIASVTVNGQSASGGTASGNGTANWSRSVSLSTGANTLTVVATDGAGNSRTTQIAITRASSADTTQPSLAITSHTSGQTVTTSSITLAGTASDSGAGGSGIASVTVNGQSASGGTASGNGTANWSRSVSLSTGANTLTVVATDGAGNSRTTQITITRQAADAAAPAVSITSHTTGQTVTTSSITLAGTATDSGSGNSGITSVTVNGSTATGGSASGSGTANWSRSVNLSAGANTVTVVATDGAGNQRTSTMSVTYTAATSRMTAASLSQNAASPQSTGTTITFTASGSGGRAPYEYQWYLQKDGGVWQMLRAWSTTTTYAWTPTQPGNYTMAIWARSSGATANAWEAYAERVFVINAQPSSDSTAPSVSVASHGAGQTVATPTVTLGGTATDSGAGGSGIASVMVNGQSASGGTASGNGTASWSRTLTLASGANVITIVATDGAGNARTATITLNYMTASPTPSGPMTSATVTSNTASPSPGSMVTFTAAGSGGTAPYEYQWYLQKDGGVWQLLRSWSTTTTYVWMANQSGNYTVAIWARSAGSTANAWQAYAERSFAVTGGGSSPQPPSVSVPMTGAALAFDRPSGQRTGTTITVAAAGTGGTAPYEYQWYVQRDGGAWQLVRPWSTDFAFSWRPTQPGQYVIAIWARSYGSTVNAWQAYAEQTFVIVP